MKTLMAVVSVCALLAAAGCETTEKIARTPREAIDNMAKAMESGDADAFVACLDVTPEEKPVARAMGEWVASIAKLRKEIIDVHGKDAWMGIWKSADIFDPPDLDKIEIEIEGDRATAKMPGEGQEPEELKKVGDRWLIRLRDIPSSEEGRRMLTEMMSTVADRIDAITGKIRDPGMTPKKLEEELRKARRL